MSGAHSRDTLVITGSDRAARDPDAICEGCGRRGTVGRASRQDASGGSLEEHQYCADCWPEWSAFYRARWQEQRRRATLAWRDRPVDAEQAALPPGGGTWCTASSTLCRSSPIRLATTGIRRVPKP